jgi:hypothetical protein
MKKILSKTITLVFVVFIVIGAYAFLNKNDTPTGQVISDASDTVKDFSQSAKDISEKTGLLDKIKNLFSSTASKKKELTKTVMDLREYDVSNEAVSKSKAIIEADELVRKINQTEINAGWQEVLGCLNDICSDSVYLEFINVINE